MADNNYCHDCKFCLPIYDGGYYEGDYCEMCNDVYANNGDCEDYEEKNE